MTASTLPLALLLAATAGCAAIAPEARQNAVEGPILDRCTGQTDPLVKAGCLRARDKALGTLTAINRDESLCLDPILSQDLDNCRARAEVDEADSRGVKLRFVDVQPSSSWAPSAHTVRWYDNAALVDIYLTERGF